MTGYEFRTIRLGLKLTQSQLGELLGFSRMHVQQMESDRKVITRPVELTMQALKTGWRPEDFAA